MTTINPWINFNGNALEAFEFYRPVFGGEFTKITRLKDLETPEFQVAPEDADKIMYIALPIGDKNLLIGNDVPSFLGEVNEKENRSKIMVQVESKQEADRVFAELSQRGEVEAEMGESPWGTYFGAFRDKFGIEWIVEYKQ